MKKRELLLIKLNASNVKENLKKGFSVISSGSIKLKKVEEFKENMKISIAVSDGIIDCEIKNISKINF